MASPPSHVEDQTDEDFFDKLVDDDFGVPTPPKAFAEEASESDEVKAFENLSIGDVGTVIEDCVEGVGSPKDLTMSSPEVTQKDILVAEESVSLVSSDPCTSHIVVESNASVTKEATLDSATSNISESRGATGIKEIQWSAFNVNFGQQQNNASGSFSDFFSDLPDSSINEPEADAMVIANSTENLMSNSQSHVSLVGTSQGYGDVAMVGTSQGYADVTLVGTSQGYGDATAETTSVQATFDSQYWENLYPGWRYDTTTGQWYQIDGHMGSSTTQEDSHDKSQIGGGDNVSEQTLEVAYMQQASQSVVGTAVDTATTGNVYNWNQYSNGTAEYPANMVFDPQYPGWYYDTILQEWRTLESYTSEGQLETTAHVHENGVRSASSGNLYGDSSQSAQYNLQASQEQAGNWSGSASYYSGRGSWNPEPVAVSSSVASGNFYGTSKLTTGNTDPQGGFKPMENAPLYGPTDYAFNKNISGAGFQSFAPADNSYQFSQQNMEQIQPKQFSPGYYSNQNSVNYSQEQYQSVGAVYNKSSYNTFEGRSSAGRPSHALVSFGFGGKLIVMKPDSGYNSSATYATQESVGGSISILNLAEVVVDKTNISGPVNAASNYFQALCQQSFPGPLVGGNVGNKEINKWIDEKISNCTSATMESRKEEQTRLLLSLLKISCQQYGKLRSPFGVDTTLQESDGPESAITRLFASAKKNSSFTHCMQNLPSESQSQVTAVDVQNLLVSGRRKEALQCAVEGQLWNLALVLAWQLGEQIYFDTVKQMTRCQLVPGSPLRTLFLLIAREPADVFSAESSRNIGAQSASFPSQQNAKINSNGMLDDWEENLAVITANRTKGDELVIICLGDCLWKERGEITAAHTCYLVAEASFESYSDSARLCLVGSDHLKNPRTYATPEAIQRTELYEYAKMLGNSQYILLPFQPYKLVYAYMLAEVGKVSDSLRYCQALLKTLKNPGRAPEVEAWRLLATSLEERLRTHQQGGYNTNLAPGKLVGKLFTSIDRSISRMIGAPPPVLSTSQNNAAQDEERESYSAVPKVATSQSTMAMSSLMPSASMEPISEWIGDGSRMAVHNRSMSEPDFARSPKQVDHSKESGSEGKTTVAGGASRFGRFGSQLLQKTMGWVSRSKPDRQAKLGERNKFYYDEKLKRWVEEGAEPPAEEAALPPPPMTASFQNSTLDGNVISASKNQTQTPPVNGGPGSISSNPTEHASGIPPIPPTNQFSARGRMGVRSRYVDTFNKGGGTATNLFQSPSVPASKPAGGAKFFVPAPSVSGESKGTLAESSQEVSGHEVSSPFTVKESFSPSPSTPSMQRFPSMDNITPGRNKGNGSFQNGNGSFHSHSRAASWSGSYPGTLKDNPNTTELKPPGGGLGSPPPAFVPTGPSMHQNGAPLPPNASGNFGDELQEVEL